MATTDIELSALADLLSERAGARRIIVAIAGAPGSGKSTLADRLAAMIDARMPGAAAVLPMDGYHYDDRLLDELGRRARKGAADTFDVAGFRHMLARLRDNHEEAIAVPVFDRDIEIARAGAQAIPRSARLIMIEGNYLLFGEPPWDRLRGRFDLSVRIDVSEAVLRERLMARWLGYGLSGEALREKIEANDLPNARTVLTKSVRADLLLVEPLQSDAAVSERR